MRFTKMHGLGNDYVHVNGFEEAVAQPAPLARLLSDRHFGIGADGLILILPSRLADVRMRMFNADGSEAQMCGNGIRCLAKYAYEHGLTRGRPAGPTPCANLVRHLYPTADDLREISVETGRGVLTLVIGLCSASAELIGADLGEPVLLPSLIPVNVTGQQAVGVPLRLEDHDLLMTCVSLGNPHAVFYTENVQEVDLERLGPLIENHPLFPERTNVHFVQPLSAAEVVMRTWERGSGLTLACGTGAAAVCVAGVLASKSDRQLLVHLPGGDLHLLWRTQDNRVYLAGPAVEVFTGDWPDTPITA